MSRVMLVELASPPPIPDTGKVRVYVNSGGTLASIDDAGTVTTYGAGITQEQVEDYVGNLLQDTSSVNVTYNDAGNVVSLDVIPGGVNHNALLNYVANQHIDHTTVSISAGTGLTGGGDISANRTISMPNTGTPGTYRSVTTDAQGRVTAGTNPTTLSGYGITDAQPLDSDLTAVAGLTGNGLIVRTGAGTATTRTLTASTGITVTNGDGVSGNPTAAITNTGVTAATYGSATQVPQVAINAQGQATSASNVSIAIPSTQVTDFTEAVQDVMGGALTDSATVDFVYNDVANTQTANVIPGGINHNALLNGGGTTHVDHAAVILSAGTYISSTGLGDITASRTINHGNSAVTPATYGGVNAIPVLGIGATGHVDSASTVNPTAALLTGLAAGTNTSITATDTLLAALAKVQAQLDSLLATDNEWIELNTASTYTNSSSVTGVNVTELALSIVSGRKYYYEATLLYQTAAAGTGIAITITSPNGGSAPGAVMVSSQVAADGTAAGYMGTINSLGDYVTSTAVQTANVPYVAHIKGNFPANASGTFNITFRSDAALSQVTVLPGSTLLVREFT